MDSLNHTTFSVKREPDFSPGLGFQSSVQHLDANKDSGPLDMDLASFLGEPGVANKSSELDSSEWNSLFTEGNLGETLDFLDPTTGVPTPMKMAEGVSSYPTNNGGQPALNGFNTVTANVPQGDQNGSFEGERASWLVQQSQKLERQQALQQQKLLELEQTLLKTEILKNRLEIVSSLKQASPSIQNQLLSALADRNALSTVSQKIQLAASLSSPITASSQMNGQAPPISRIPITIASVSQPVPMSIHEDIPISTTVTVEDEFLPGGKKKSHNLIEKKYRTSINDRIGMLRSIVSRHFKDDKKVQKSAVLQKTIDYIRYLENMNRKLRDENKQLKTMLNPQQGTGYPLDSVGSSPMFQHSSESSGDEGHPTSPDVFLSDTSPNASPPSISPSPFFQSHPSTASATRFTSRIFMCLILVICFFADPFSLSGGQLGTAPSGSHGSQRTLSWMNTDIEGTVTVGWVLMWMFRCLVASICFGIVWVYALPRHNPEWEGMRFWRLRKQAEQDIKKSDFASAQIHLVSALTEVGLPLPTSYTSLVLSLIWNGLSHLLFQLFVGRVVVSMVSFFVNKGRELSSGRKGLKGAPQSVGHADVAHTMHLLHQISLAEYDGRTMHGVGSYLGLSALNYAEVGRPFLPDNQWYEMMFTMGVQCQFSCVCVTSLLARYYFVCAGNLGGGLLSFTETDDGWEYLISKEWIRDVQLATKHYKGVSVFPKYSITRSFCRTLLTEAYRDLLLPQHQNPRPHVASSADITECLRVFQTVRDIARKTNGFLIEDIQKLTGGLPTLSDTMATKESGFEPLLWWACMGLVACHWSKGETKQCKELYSIVTDVPEKSSPIPTALHLAFKAQHLHRGSAPPPRVLNQLCLTASQSLNDCGQKMNSEDNLNLLGLLLACDWLLSVQYSLWEEQHKNPEEETTVRQVVANFREDIDTLSHLTSLLPGAFPLLSKFKGYQRLMSGGNPLFANTFLSAGGVQVPALRHRDHLMAKSN